jgi:soluble lytic murein transglycosylase
MRALPVALGSLLALLVPDPAAAVGPDGDGTSPAVAEAVALDGVLVDPAIALREAQRARAAGDSPRAEALLKGVALRHPVIADHADRLLIDLLLSEGRAGEAASVARGAFEAYPESPLRGEFQQGLGTALAELGDEPGARDAWQQAVRDTRSDALEATLQLAIAQSYERTGDLRTAAATYRIIWVSHPTRDEAEEATARLDALEGKLGPQRDANDWKRRGDRLFRRRHNPEALEAYDRALEDGLSPSAARRTRQQRAHTLFRMRRYPEAVKAFATLPASDDTALWHARSLARSGEVMRSIDEFEDLAGRARTGTMRMRATFLAALLLDGRDFEERANRHFQRVARSSASSLSSAALWRLAWAAYRGARYEEAVELFDRLIVVNGEGIPALRGRYWRARALGQLSDDRARPEFTALATEYPFTYYGWRARTRAQADASSPSPTPPAAGDRQLSATQLERPRILLAADLREAARGELEKLRRKAGGVSDRVELCGLLADAGDFNHAQRVMTQAYEDELTGAPVPRFEDIWWHAWPAAYWDLVQAATASPGSVEPALVLSIMREESGYRPAVISPVGARGLMQIMIPTGERLAEQVGLPGFDADDLFDPATNIRLGAHYLTRLADRFDGRLSGAIASYNAGPEAVSSWGPSEPGADDEWVESIPYDQTRSYVKRVLRSLRAYQVLY